MIYLHKLLPALVSPMAILAALLVLALLVRARWPRVLALALLLIVSSPLVAERAMRHLERGHPPIALDGVPPVDAIVVLGGMVRTVPRPDGGILHEFTDRVDRLEAGLALLALGKAERIVFTRGQAPWSVGRPEGEHLRERAIARGVDPDRIALTGIARNTEEEAAAVAAMTGAGERVALVTSAFHMPRAVRVFEARGVDVVPVPVDYMSSAGRLKPTDLLPDGEAVMKVSLFVREMIGRAWYALRT